MRTRVEPWHILKNNLASFVGVDTTNQSSGGLWNSRDDTDFIANSGIYKAGFPRAGPSEKRNVSDMAGRGGHNNTERKNKRAKRRKKE